MKKYLFTLLMLVAVHFIIGCSNKKSESNSNEVYWIIVPYSEKPTFQSLVADSLYCYGYDISSNNADAINGLMCNLVQTIPHSSGWTHQAMIDSLIDRYNVQEIDHKINVDIDRTLVNGGFGYELIDSLNKIDLSSIQDDTLRLLTHNHIAALKNALITMYTNSQKEGRDIGILDFHIDEWAAREQAYKQLQGYYIKTDNNNHCIVDSLSESPIFNPSYWFPEVYSKYVGPEASPTSKDWHKLYSKMLKEKNFNKRCAMLFALLAKPNENIISETHKAFYVGFPTAMLYPLWRAYRVANATINGYSKTSYIPNLDNDYYRRLVAFTLLCRLDEDPNDNIAMVQYYLISETQSILREGNFPYGNQADAESISIYWHHTNNQ